MDEASPNGGAGGLGQKGEEEADAVMSHLVLDDRTWFLAESFKVCFMSVCVGGMHTFIGVYVCVDEGWGIVSINKHMSRHPQNPHENRTTSPWWWPRPREETPTTCSSPH